MSDQQYIHGFSPEEQERLKEQNSVLAKYIYERCPFGRHKRILEVGCGVGAQMDYVYNHYAPDYLCGIDISAEQIETARHTLQHLDQNKVELVNADVSDYNPDELFDHLLYIWVLEHVQDPLKVLRDSLHHLEPGGSVFITEVNHESLRINGASEQFYQLWSASLDYQSKLGGDATIGQRMPQILSDCDVLTDISVKPYGMHFDEAEAEARDEMLTYFVDLVESAALPMIADKYIEQRLWTSVKKELQSLVGKPSSSFHYAFEQGIAIKK